MVRIGAVDATASGQAGGPGRAGVYEITGRPQKARSVAQGSPAPAASAATLDMPYASAAIEIA